MDNAIFQLLAEKEKQLLINSGQKDTLLSSIKSKEEELKNKQDLINNLEQAIQFLVQTAQQARTSTIKSIESLATVATQAVYDDSLQISSEYMPKNKSDSSDRMYFQLLRTTNDGDLITTGLMDEVGGGLIETVSFALRIACLKWLGYKGPIILDEAYKSLSNDEKILQIATLLNELNTTVGNQIIFSTHNQEVFFSIASKKFHVTHNGDVSEVKEC